MTLVEQILPILLIILVGVALRRFEVFSPSAIESLTRVVVNIVLPSVLFTVFLEMEMKPAYAGVFVVVGGICLGLYGLGFVLGRLVAPHHPYFRFLFTGLEYGMLGVSLFGGAYGLEKVGYAAQPFRPRPVASA
ncbi:AEC family transporter [Cohaesibacter sp. ES.047]|uniref:AEC family transporter n=1 Tax=Cohaesibacter sp. ES.047 TaxID=1798205 RepID=UPI000BB7150C|nr:AEC family transporter [Cohaesibacter sp. ES.047]